MKVNALLVLILLCSLNCFAGPVDPIGGGGGLHKDKQLFFLQLLGEGGHGGGPRYSISLNNGGVGGGPRLSVEQIKKIDNIEVDHEIRFPKTFKEKCLLLTDPKIQTIQFRNGEMLIISDLFGDGGVMGGGGSSKNKI